MIAFTLFPIDKSCFKVKSRRSFTIKSDKYTFNNGEVRYPLDADWKKVEDVVIELDEDAETEYEDIMREGLSEKDLDNYLAVMYRDILKHISENIEEGILAGGFPLGDFDVKIFIAPNWVVIDKRFPYARLMVGIGNELIDTLLDDDTIHEAMSIINFSKNFHLLTEYIDTLYNDVCSRIIDRVQTLKGMK